MKKIVFCSDGTRNSPKDKTNVWKTYQNLKVSPTQHTEYDKGVGTRFGNFLRGAAFGRGLSINVMDGFKYISRTCEPDDSIYLFGFSRGAYTVRSLASMISLCGLAPKDATGEVFAAYWKAYKRNRKPEHFKRVNNELAAKHGSRNVDIKALCVWDTVGAIGRQTRTRDIRKKLSHRFHRMSVFPSVKRVFHAVSLDERRTQYFPHLLSGQAESNDTLIEEVWFPGVHSDIGGGYRDDDPSLGDLTLSWMLSKIDGELEFKDGFIESLQSDPLGAMHNAERGMVFSLFQKKNRPVARRTSIHRAVIQRIEGPLKKPHQHREPTGNYTPLSLTFANYASPPKFGIELNYNVVTGSSSS